MTTPAPLSALLTYGPPRTICPAVTRDQEGHVVGNCTRDLFHDLEPATGMHVDRDTGARWGR